MSPCVGSPILRAIVLGLLAFVSLASCGGTAGNPGADSAPSSSPPPLGPFDLQRLFFACVGDTRAAVENDPASYPTNVIGALFAEIQALSPRPPIVLSTGDYVFASPGAAAEASAQLDLYLAARHLYEGAFLPALGNHECTGATASNCGPGARDGTTPIYDVFRQKMLAPLGAAEPYYIVRVRGPGAAWTAKFVVLAANAWSSEQAIWFDAALSEPSTYTFVVRHESAEAVAAPGVLPSEAILAAHPYTLVVVGHDHTYEHRPERPREVIIGNGGAPLMAKNFGFGLFSQRPDGAIEVDMIDWQTGRADAAFRFAVAPDGSPL
jgi:hypothetical protein